MAGENTRMGANLTHGGATFRIWAPNATEVSVRGSFNDWAFYPLDMQLNGYWHAFVPGVREGDQYKYYVSTLR